MICLLANVYIQDAQGREQLISTVYESSDQLQQAMCKRIQQNGYIYLDNNYTKVFLNDDELIGCNNKNNQIEQKYFYSMIFNLAFKNQFPCITFHIVQQQLRVNCIEFRDLKIIEMLQADSVIRQEEVTQQNSLERQSDFGQILNKYIYSIAMYNPQSQFTQTGILKAQSMQQYHVLSNFSLHDQLVYLEIQPDPKVYPQSHQVKVIVEHSTKLSKSNKYLSLLKLPMITIPKLNANQKVKPRYVIVLKQASDYRSTPQVYYPISLAIDQ